MFLFPTPEPTKPVPSGADSTKTAVVTNPAAPNPTPQPQPVLLPDSVRRQQLGAWAGLGNAAPQDVVISNPDLQVTLSSRGGKIKQVQLKNYVTYQKQPLVLIDERSSQTSLVAQTAIGPIDLHQLAYSVAKKSEREVVFRFQLDSARYVEQRYVLPEQGFTVSYRADLGTLGGELKSSALAFGWSDRLKQQEKDLNTLRNTSTVNFYTAEGSLETLSETSRDPEEAQAEGGVRWVALKQKFFNTAFITNQAFSKVKVASQPAPETSKDIKTLGMSLEIPVADLADEKAGLRYYFGPNDFRIAEKVAPGFEGNVYLGWAIFNTVNRYLIIPLFELLEKASSNYGVVIFLLVLVVKTLLFPLVYRSYMSMAKMRVLKPEIDAIKAKHGENMQAAQQEQMKLYGQFGVNPLMGCIPVLLQLPVLLAMFNFFPNAIALRQKTFLWADDLSSYDSVLNLSFTIPFYGDHVSLFTILMTLSTIAYTYYNNQLQSVSVDKAMQTVSYLMPVIFMFVLNSFSSGLTYYYFVSNIITIAQQLGIRKFVDEGKIRAMLDENHRKNTDPNRKKSSFQERLEAAMRNQQEATAKAKTNKNGAAPNPKDKKK
ncbi:MAG: membrane protein insertase YidC [Bernardetiaceae bacterium]|nr:membrane protein insertase YidC [Bernardetiaceae bacterium]